MSMVAVVFFVGRQVRRFAVLVALLALVAPARAASPLAYHLERTFALGGEGGWDYLTYDATTQRLFISRGTRVMVVDPKNGTVVGTIDDTPGVHGIAIAPDLGVGFTSNGRDNSVTVFDTKTLKTISKVGLLGRNPDAIVYDPASAHVFTMNGGSANVSAVDAAHYTVDAT